MPSTYTTNLGIEKIATGEQAGTWGLTTNTNFDLIDQAVNGVALVTIASAGSSGSPNTLPISEGAVSAGRNAVIVFNDAGDLGGTAYVQLTPSSAEKVVFIRNSLSASRSLIVFQGTYNASNDYEIPNGKDVLLKFDGGGTGAIVSPVIADFAVDAITLNGTDLTTTLSSKADLASPTFTGTVNAATITATGTVTGGSFTTTGAATVDDLTINGFVNEQQYSLTGTDIDPLNGTIQYKTLSANTTFTESLSDGDYVTLMIDDGTAYTITWPTITWVGGAAPTLETTGYNVIELWQVNGTVYGASIGAA